MRNGFVYDPRHATVDRPGLRTRRRSEPARSPPAGVVQQIRSVELSDTTLGLLAKIEVVEIQGNRVQPIDRKKSKRPHIEPVEVLLDDELAALTQSKIIELRGAAESDSLPPPLEDSPKCVRCSLAPICMPDELRFLRGTAEPPRQLLPASDHSFPLYVQQPGAVVRKKDETLQVFDHDEKLGAIRTRELSQLGLIAAGFDSACRNRRSPRDSINALLSFAYSMLTREWTTVCRA
jgi:CRISPR-associated protein Cas1